MAKLDAKERDSLGSRMFGLPDQRKYPMPDKNHARDALSRAKQELDAGRLSKGDYSDIVNHAHQVLHGKGR